MKSIRTSCTCEVSAELDKLSKLLSAYLRGFASSVFGHQVCGASDKPPLGGAIQIVAMNDTFSSTLTSYSVVNRADGVAVSILLPGWLLTTLEYWEWCSSLARATCTILIAQQQSVIMELDFAFLEFWKKYSFYSTHPVWESIIHKNDKIVFCQEKWGSITTP